MFRNPEGLVPALQCVKEPVRGWIRNQQNSHRSAHTRKPHDHLKSEFFAVFPETSDLKYANLSSPNFPLEKPQHPELWDDVYKGLCPPGTAFAACCNHDKALRKSCCHFPPPPKGIFEAT